MSFPKTHTAAHSHTRTHFHTHAQSTDALRILIHTNPYLIRATPSLTSLTGNVWSGLVLQECVGSFAYFTLTGFSTGASRHDSIQFNPTQPDSTLLSAASTYLRCGAYHDQSSSNAKLPQSYTGKPLPPSSISSSVVIIIIIFVCCKCHFISQHRCCCPTATAAATAVVRAFCCHLSTFIASFSFISERDGEGMAGVRGLFGPLFARCAAGGAVHRFRLANVVPRVVFGGLCLAARLGTVGLALKCLPS